MANSTDSICNEGIIKAIQGETVTVEMITRSACSGCHAKSLCLLSEQKKELVTAKNIHKEQFSIGEAVVIYMKKGLGRKAVVIGYLIPFIILFAALFLTYNFTKNELLGFAVSVSLTAIYYFIIWWMNRRKKIDEQFLFFVKKKN